MSGYEGGPQERFEEFLRTYKDEQGNTPYWTKIQRFSIDEATSLSIDFQDLMSFDNVVFRTLAKDDPQQFLNTLDSVLRSVLISEDRDYMESIDKNLIRVRIINYHNYVSLRAIRSRHIGTIINISGVMMRASEVKPLLVDATFQCRRCNQEISLPQEDGRYMEPDHCPTCGKKTPVRLLPEKSIFRDWQKVRIQETPEELPPGQMPRSIDVILEGDIVDVSRPGDLVKITGILQTSPDFSRRSGKLATFNIFIQANGIEIGEKEYEQIELTEEDLKEIEKTAEDPYVHERIFASIAPSIQGHENIKESIALLLFGGVGKTLPDGTRLRGRSNILMIGDPGTGKSQILKFVSKLIARSIYTSGKGTSAAGLTAAVMHDAETGSMTLEAGALVLADQGIACIDEFDKMDPNDRTAIHEAMEQHTVSIAKAGIVATLNARTSILAAANPIYGRYESSMSVKDNIKLPFTILSRFDLLWILVDTVEPKKDRELAQFILGMHQSEKTSQQSTTPPLSPEFLKKYIGFSISSVRPQLSSEAAEEIENFYVNLRKSAEGGAAPVPITARQLEALVRLSEARARMGLRTKVTREDAKAAIRLMNESLRMVALNQDGKIDIDKLVSPMDSGQRNDSDKIRRAMDDFESRGISVVSAEELLTMVESMGVPRDRAESVLRKMILEGILFEPSTGKVKRVQS